MNLLPGDESSGDSMVFISSAEFGELIAELRRLNTGPSFLVSVLRELERHGVLSEREKALEILQDALARRASRPQPSELGEAVARVILSGDINPDNLENAAEALQSLARLAVAKGAHSRAAERAKETVARALLPALQSYLVPRWVYRSLERTTAQLRERVALQELELERLKTLLKRSGREVPVQRLYIVSGLLEEDPLPMEGEIVKIPCTVCRELNFFHLPREEVCREAGAKHLLFRLHCSYCGRPIDLEPERVLRLLEARVSEAQQDLRRR